MCQRRGRLGNAFAFRAADGALQVRAKCIDATDMIDVVVGH